MGKDIATKPDNQNSISGIHMVARKDKIPQVVLWFLHMHHGKYVCIYTCIYTYIYTHNKYMWK